MKLWQWVVFSVVVYIFFLVAYAPAALALRFIPENANIRINQVSGTLFAGQSRSVVINGIRLDNFTWDVAASKLLLGRVEAKVNGGALRDESKAYIDGIVGTSMFSTQAIKAKDAKLMVPLKSILAQIKLPVVVTTQGRVRVDIESLEMEERCERLQGNGVWNNARVTANQESIDLGNFEARLSCEEDKFAVTVTSDELLSLDAKFLLDTQGNISRSGTFTLSPSLPAQIRNAAVIFGRANSEGVYTLN